MKRETISIVIPSYDGLQLLKKNLSHVLDVLIDGDELVIVDDASTDDSVAYLVEQYDLKRVENFFQRIVVPANYAVADDISQGEFYKTQYTYKSKKINCIVFKNCKNLRFGLTANIGFVLATNSYIFLCNNDVIPQSQTLEKLITHFSDTRVFGVGCMEYKDSLTGEKSGKNKLWFQRGLFQHAQADDMKSGETAWVSGGSGLFSKAKWLELGGFDPRFAPAYWEDIDISYQAKKHGYSVLFEAEAIVLHKHETTNSTVFGSKAIAAMSWNNAFKFTWKNGSTLQRIKFLCWLPYWLLKSDQSIF